MPMPCALPDAVAKLGYPANCQAKEPASHQTRRYEPRLLSLPQQDTALVRSRQKDASPPRLSEHDSTENGCFNQSHDAICRRHRPSPILPEEARFYLITSPAPKLIVDSYYGCSASKTSLILAYY
ncbi:hypothetical protein IF2G_06364 [Cordyceps javanica]|nr:hypothetical protein IF2G_06364 [Cordyceps javanica]